MAGDVRKDDMTMEITTLRILTAKSQLKVGPYASLTVDKALGVDPKILRRAYYHFEPIDFTQEVKDAAGIRILIEKPGTSHGKYVENEILLRQDMTDEERMKTAAVAKRFRRAEEGALKHGNALGSYMSKGYMQNANLGRAKWKK